MSEKKQLQHPITGLYTTDYTIVNNRPDISSISTIYWRIIFNNPEAVVDLKYNFLDELDNGTDPESYYTRNYNKFAQQVPAVEYSSTMRPIFIVAAVIGVAYIILKVIK